MARLRSPEKRKAILQAAIEEIDQLGLGAPTAKIARRAGVAEGTLFTYFSSKDELLNELYLELKSETYERVYADFSPEADLRERAWHVWSSYLDWVLEFPKKRKVSAQLNVSDVIGAETRAKAAAGRRGIEKMLEELGERGARDLPKEFASTAILAMQEATIDLIAKHPKQRKVLIERTFEALWRMFS